MTGQSALRQQRRGGGPLDLDPEAEEMVRAAVSRSRSDRRSTVWLQAATGLAILAVWQLIANLGLINVILTGDPVGVAKQFVAILLGETIYSRTIYDHIWTSLQVVVLGYIGGAAVGIVTGFLFGRSPLLRRVFEPAVLAIASLPKIAIAPLFVIFLGIGMSARLAIVFIEVFFMLFFNTMRGVFEVNEEYVNIARILGASRRQVIRDIIIPAALPDIFLGLRLGVPFAMTGVVIAEFIASNQGIGWLILYSSSTISPNRVWSAVAFLIATTWVLNLLIARLEARALRWQPQRSEGLMAV